MNTVREIREKLYQMIIILKIEYDMVIENSTRDTADTICAALDHIENAYEILCEL